MHWKMGFDVQEAPLDTALVDGNMPGMNGYDFVKAVCANRDVDKLRLIRMELFSCQKSESFSPMMPL